MPQSRIGELYLRHADAAARLAYLLTGDREMAEDLVQDAFVKLAGRLVHLRDPEAFDAYLRATIVNLSRSYLRRRRVERQYLEQARRTDGSEAYSPGRSVEDQDELWHAMRRLTQRQRAAIVLRFYEDLPEVEVAEILQCAPGTVKSLVSRGLEKLRSEIGGEDE
ncbi:MAG: SigE family RNA polymerase sigma factor [Actinomycetota bacterium]|nr:SigE family RNA polymerase sigma factor [Actinomycetota bacterium]